MTRFVTTLVLATLLSLELSACAAPGAGSGILPQTNGRSAQDTGGGMPTCPTTSIC